MVDNGAALLVCDSLKGLLRVNLASGEVRVLSNRVTDSGDGSSGLPSGERDARSEINYANDLDVADTDSDGIGAVCVSPSRHTRTHVYAHTRTHSHAHSTHMHKDADQGVHSYSH